jgi:hypothetical protein
MKALHAGQKPDPTTGVSADYVRLSLGIEHFADLQTDLEQALVKVWSKNIHDFRIDQTKLLQAAYLNRMRRFALYELYRQL